MPNIKSAKKRVLVIEKKRIQNRSQLSALKTQTKKFNAAIDVNDIKLAEELLPELFSIVDGCCQKGILHINNAANKKSAAAKRLSDVKSGKLKITIKKDNRTIAAEKAKAAQEARLAARAESKKQSEAKKAEKEAAEKAALVDKKGNPITKEKAEKIKAKEKAKAKK